MRVALIALACLGPTSAVAQRARAPIIDMHLHAGPADAQGPPPVRICTPFQYLPTRDPQQSPEEYAATLRQQRECPTLLMRAGTNAELLEQTVEVLKRRNAYAVTSGAAPSLSQDQKRDIFHSNAVWFLRLSEDEVARHHGRRPDRMR
jgi:uncharacterized protein